VVTAPASGSADVAFPAITKAAHPAAVTARRTAMSKESIEQRMTSLLMGNLGGDAKRQHRCERGSSEGNVVELGTARGRRILEAS
jgi:hypothetical protein